MFEKLFIYFDKKNLTFMTTFIVSFFIYTILKLHKVLN